MRCDLPGVSVHYKTVGRGRPFLLLHGSPGDHIRAMLEVEPAFRGQTGWKRIYPDLPGHGRSPRATRIANIDDYLEVLVEFVDRALPRQRFTLGGISFGAYLALGLTHRRAHLIDGLLLSTPEVYFGPLEERREREERRQGAPRVRAEADARPGWKGYTEDTEWLEGLPWRDLSFDLYRRRRTFQAPTLFLLGRQDAQFRYKAYWNLLPHFPRATYAVLDGAGHMLWADRQEMARALVRDWLARVEDWAPARSRIER